MNGMHQACLRLHHPQQKLMKHKNDVHPAEQTKGRRFLRETAGTLKRFNNVRKEAGQKERPELDFNALKKRQESKRERERKKRKEENQGKRKEKRRNFRALKMPSHSPTKSSGNPDEARMILKDPLCPQTQNIRKSLPSSR